MEFPEVVPAALTGAAATYYTVPSNRKLIRVKMLVNNTSLSPVVVTVYAVPNAGSPGVANCIFNDTVDGIELVELDVTLNLAAGGTIQALAASAGVVSLRIAPALQIV